MNASVQPTQVPSPVIFRWAARAAGVIATLTWLELVLYEWVKVGSPDFRNSHQSLQAAALAIVFAGYLVGWRNELLGGVLSILGTIAFVLIVLAFVASGPSAAAAWFAAPGLLYILAWYSSSHRYEKLQL
jgi:hypothetical protein